MPLLKGRIIQALDSQVNTEPSLVPKPPFSAYLVSQKGGGKSTALLNLMLSKDLLGGRFNQVYVICPTNKLDSKWNILKETKGTLSVNYKLLNALKKDKKISILDNIGGINPEYSTVIPPENFIDVVNSDLLKSLIKEQKMVIETYGKDTADSILLIYDDTISAKKFWSSEKIQQLMFLPRHYKISLLVTSQNYKSLPKCLRLNMSILILFYSANTDEIKSIYDENSSSLGFKEFYKIYQEVCRQKPFHFLTINYQNPPEYRLQSAFEHFIEN